MCVYGGPCLVPIISNQPLLVINHSELGVPKQHNQVNLLVLWQAVCQCKCVCRFHYARSSKTENTKTAMEVRENVLPRTLKNCACVSVCARTFRILEPEWFLAMQTG